MVHLLHLHHHHEGPKHRSVMPPWWRWVVLGATLYMNCIVNGYTYCFGLIKLPIQEEYPHVKPIFMAIVGGIVPSMYMFLAPVAIAVQEFFGPRPVTICASCLSAFCFFLAWLNGTVLHAGFEFDLLVLGFGQGLAFAFLYGPSVAVLPNYFPISQLALAAGIANAGSSIGVIIYGLITNPLFAHFGWRGTMLFYAGISLQGVIAGLAFMKMAPINKTPEKKPETVELAETTQGEIKEGEGNQALLSDKQDPKKTETASEKKSFLPVLRRYFDVNLFKQWPFVSLICAAGLSIVGYFVPTLLLPGHAKDPQNGVNVEIAKNIMAIFGVLNLLGRIVLGKIGDFGFRFAIFSAYWLYIGSLVIGAICFLIIPHVMAFGTVPFVVFAVVYGFSAAPIITMRSILTTTLFGKKNANASYGWFLCAQGALQILGYILPAWFDAALGPVFAYMFAAGCFLLAAFCCAITAKPFFAERQKLIQEMAAK